MKRGPVQLVVALSILAVARPAWADPTDFGNPLNPSGPLNPMNPQGLYQNLHESDPASPGGRFHLPEGFDPKACKPFLDQLRKEGMDLEKTRAALERAEGRSTLLGMGGLFGGL